ncbi:HTTM domain-containing protein [Glycomyces buryatensis]|uniref:MFS transporter permease n=1 Tax=Glycomyces buryatensis TaxID=2570927 RepID=A0A4S8Q2W5_9ACTN|nr:HTTM domain-containing protein [Glycomyces buryatensis]THV38537.1 MFS transporter permease [Glycomyces buryatensis]
MTTLRTATRNWFFPPTALGRVAAMRFLAGVFLMVEWWAYMPYIFMHRFVPEELYQPLMIGRLLPIPAPNYWIVTGTLIVILASALPMMFGYKPRLFGWILLAAYMEWMIIANSYGKVDHASFGFMMLLAMLPLMPEAKWGDTETLSERVGWGFNLVQIAVVFTYFLSAFAKFRYGGFGWVNSGTLTWALLRRGTDLSSWMLDYPWMLRASQWGIVIFELLTPIVLFVGKWKKIQYAIVAFFFCFHITVFAAVTISFLPHVFALSCFLPLERINPRDLARKARNRLRRNGAVPPAQSKGAETKEEAELAS